MIRNYRKVKNLERFFSSIIDFGFSGFCTLNVFHNLNKVLFYLCLLLRKECYKLGLDGGPLPAHECVPSPNSPVMLLDRALRLNMDFQGAVRQPKAPMFIGSFQYLLCSFAKGFSQSTKLSIPHTEIP